MSLKLASAGLLILALVPTLSFAVDVPKWNTYDINLTATTSYANAYLSGPSLTATFTGPGGVTKTVTGFWDGTNNFKVRFTPTVEGVWSYTTSSSDSTLNAKTGSIHATVAVAGQHGFLRIDPVYKTSFAWDDGTRYFMEGQTYYDWMQAANVNKNWKSSVDNMLKYGFSKVRFDVYANNVPGEHNDYPDIEPYVDMSVGHVSPDRDALNLTYWRKLDEMVQYMNVKGLVADFIITTPYRNNRQYGTAAQNDRFIKYVVSRYAAYTNVIWCLANEWDLSQRYKGTNIQYKADFNRMGAMVRNGDPWIADGPSLRPLSIHTLHRNVHFPFFDAAWPTYAVLQYGRSDDREVNAGIIYDLGHNMPVADDEYFYIGQITPTKHRQSMWGIAAAGGYSSTADFREHPNGKGIPESTGDWTYQPEYDDVKHMVDFFTTKGIEYWKMASHNELAIVGTRVYVLAETGRQYVVYAAVGGTFSINLAAGIYYTYQYNPRTGETMPLTKVAGGGLRLFTMLDSTHDWVLHLSAFKENQAGEE